MQRIIFSVQDLRAVKLVFSLQLLIEHIPLIIFNESVISLWDVCA